MPSYDQKTVKKSRYWHKHGKHAKIDPTLIANDRSPRTPKSKMFDSIRDLFNSPRI